MTSWLLWAVNVRDELRRIVVVAIVDELRAGTVTSRRRLELWLALRAVRGAA
jgi:hypothetical protein